MEEKIKNFLEKIITLRDIFFILIGVILSISITYQIYKYHFSNMILMKKFVYEKKVYNINEEILK